MYIHSSYSTILLRSFWVAYFQLIFHGSTAQGMQIKKHCFEHVKGHLIMMKWTP